MKKNRIALLFAFVLMLLSPLTVHAYTIPEPSDDLYVSDYADVIDREVEEEIINANLELEEKNGVQILKIMPMISLINGESVQRKATTASYCCWLSVRIIIIVLRVMV